MKSNNNSPLQHGTPTKLACPVKEKPKLRGGICSQCAHWSDLPSKIKSINLKKFVGSLLQLPSAGVAGAASGNLEGKILRQIILAAARALPQYSLTGAG